MVKGASVGFGLGGVAAVAYARQVGVFGQTPLGVFVGDYVLVMFGIVVAGTVLGALIAREIGKSAGTSRKDTSGG